MTHRDRVTGLLMSIALLAWTSTASGQVTSTDTANTPASNAPASQGYVPIATPVPAPAQPAAPTQPAAAAATANAAVATPFTEILPARSLERIQAGIQATQMEIRESDAARSRATELRALARGQLDLKKRELSVLDQRIKNAKKGKQDVEAMAATAEKRISEREKSLLERRIDLHGTEIEVAEKGRLLAIADRKALDLEKSLATHRAERAALGTTPSPTSGANRLDQLIHELERNTLEAQRGRASAASEVANREHELVERRIAMYDAQLGATGLQKP